jgi:hypothetical protein
MTFGARLRKNAQENHQYAGEVQHLGGDAGGARRSEHD